MRNPYGRFSIDIRRMTGGGNRPTYELALTNGTVM